MGRLGWGARRAEAAVAFPTNSDSNAHRHEAGVLCASPSRATQRSSIWADSRGRRSARLRWRGWLRGPRWLAAVLAVTPGAVGALQKRLNQVDRHREDDRRGTRATDLEECLQVAELQRDRVLLE